MELLSVANVTKRKNADLLVLPYWRESKKAKEASKLCSSFASITTESLQIGDFTGKEGEVLFLYPSSLPEKRVVLLGLGEKAKCSSETLRKAYAGIAKGCRAKKIRSLNLVIPDLDKLEEKERVFAVTEGICLASYYFDALKTSASNQEKPTNLEKVTFLEISSSSMKSAEKAFSIVQAVNMARDLVNHNADHVNPSTIAEAAKGLAKQFSSITTTVLTRKEMEKNKMGLLLAVSRGSSCDPSFSLIEYKGDPKSSEKVAIVGKGVTYDTGGLNIKPTGGMETMKCDMSGAAAVLGTLQAVATLGLKINVVGVIPSTENAIGPHSYKPGDVYTSFSGKTVEITNTDAEGRLILADAVSYVEKHFSPTCVIDLATLTGAIVISLGEEASGLFSNDDKLSASLLKAGEATHERLWRMPLFPEYKDILKSPIADMKNWNGREGGSCVAATFIGEFIKEGTPWAHLDIAGTAFLSKPKSYHNTNATGVGIRLLVNFLETKEK